MNWLDGEPRPQSALQTEPFHAWLQHNGTQWMSLHRTTNGYLLRFPGMADFFVSHDGCSVESWRTPALTANSLEHLYLNQVLPLALAQQGRMVFHGSAVELHGRAVAFLGESGRGKSTLATSFALNGARFLTDDGLHVEQRNERYVVLPSHPSVRLWEDSQEALSTSNLASAPPLPFTSKSRILADNKLQYCDEAQPLRCVYFLGQALVNDITVAQLSAAQALVELTKHTFMLDIEDKALLRAKFEFAANMSCTTPFFKLDFPRVYSALPELRATIISHHADLHGANHATD